MKKLLTLFLIFTLCSCNDGDFDVPSFNFEATVNSCGSYVLYISNSSKTEILALSLVATHLGTTAGEKTISIGSTAATSSIKATYRILDEAFGTDYFCQNIPPVSPRVSKELVATEGKVLIKTSEVLTGTKITGYKHEITLTQLLFFDGTERVYFETFSFGTITINV